MKLLVVLSIFATFASAIQEKDQIASDGLPLPQGMTFCPHLCKCETVNKNLVINCNHQALTNIPEGILDSVITLNLNENNITELNGDRLKHLKNIQHLSAAKNKIARVTSDSLSSFLDIVSVDLSFNQITFMPSTALQKLKKLEVLNLSHNKITVISRGMLFSVTSLLTLNLGHNSLSVMDHDQFVYLHQLKHLDLSSNKLTVMKHDWFQHLAKLEYLNLSRNQFSAIDNLMFVNMVKLVSLDLSHNNISSLGTVSFKGLISLKNLKLNGNLIARFPYHVFSLMTSIKSLDLSSNPFKSLKNSFNENHSLQLLWLNNLTEIEHISDGSFDSLVNLQELSISGNKKLQTIGAKAFDSLKNCKYLNLTHNSLRSMPRHFLDGLHNLRSISLYGNRWVCDCRMFWLFAWLRSLPVGKTNFNKHDSTFCAEPMKYSNKTILGALDVIPCRNASITRTTKNSEFKVGSSALLVCNATGFPTPNVKWSTPDRSLYRVSFNSSLERHSNISERVHVLKNGNLFIKKLLRNDAGYYFCTAGNVLNNVTKPVHLMLDYRFMTEIELISLAVGFAMSIAFLLVTLVVLLFMMIAQRMGWHCCCSNGSVSPKTKQIRKMLEYMEQYKEHQLEKLRENYTQQTQKIRDNCGQQMEKIRENYSLQFERIQNIRDYGNQQIDKVRDNYNQQVQRVRDYSAGQLDKLRDNYLYQRNRIRKFSAHHLYKLRENYKLQQQHLNKIIEHLNLDSCRTVCARTDSIIFEPDLTMETVFRDQIACLPDPLDQFPCEKFQGVDTLSQNSSYFTPTDSISRAESPGPRVEELTLKLNELIDSSGDDDETHQAVDTQEANIDIESAVAGDAPDQNHSADNVVKPEKDPNLVPSIEAAPEVVV